MMTLEHKKEIREYLIAKKLPLDILIELEDHFLSQIDHLMIQNISFERAFDEVKQIWKEDLKFTKSFNGEEVPVFVKTIKDKKINRLLSKSLLLVCIILLGVFLLSKFNVKGSFEEIMIYFFYVISGIPAIYYLLNIKWFNLIFRNKSFKINIYQGANIMAFLPVLMMLGGSFFSKMAERIYDFVNVGSRIGLASFILLACFLWFFSFGFLMQIAFIQSIKKMKPYLKTFNL